MPPLTFRLASGACSPSQQGAPADRQSRPGLRRFLFAGGRGDAYGVPAAAGKPASLAPVERAGQDVFWIRKNRSSWMGSSTTPETLSVVAANCEIWKMGT